MRLTDDGLGGIMDYDTCHSVNMSVASDASSREGSGSGLGGSGTVRRQSSEFIWSDERFNTLKASRSGRDRSQDSQSSETGSESSGSAFLNNSHPHGGLITSASQCQSGGGVRNHANKIVSPGHSYTSSVYQGSESDRFPMDEDRAHSDPYPAVMNMSVSYDQSLMIHAIRKQKALAHYYELMENNNQKCAQSNHHGNNPQVQDNNNIKYNPVQNASPGNPQDQYSGDRLHQGHRSNLNSDFHPNNTRREGTNTSSASEPSPPAIPPRLMKPSWKPPMDQVIDHDVPTHPFYLPVSSPYNGAATGLPHTRNGLPHLFANRSRDANQVHHDTRDLSPRTLARAAFQTRALSLDFGLQKVPDFPCHRAALEETRSGPTTPVKEHPIGKNGLNKSWHGYPVSVPQDSPVRKSLGGKFALHSISESLVGILKSPQTVRRAKPVERSPTTKSTYARDAISGDGTLKRSSSAPNQLDDWTEDEDDEAHSSRDLDGNDDDFGFRNHPRFTHVHAPPKEAPAGGSSSPGTPTNYGHSSTGMQKAKSPAAPRRILPKRWRKSKTLSAANKHVSIWKPEGGCVWSCKNGRQLTLGPVSLLTLTEIERVALQKIAQSKLQAIDLGCQVPIPKDWNRNKRSKKSTFSSLRKRTASTSALESKGKEGRESSGVFGIPLGLCIANDQDLRRRKSCLLQDRQDCLEIPTHTPRHTRKSSSSSTAVSSESLSENEHRSHGSNLLDALSLSTSSSLDPGVPRADLEGSPLAAHVPLVPCIVSKCCKHLETYGLRVLGIFRIGSSKKRAKQLREEIDSCGDIKLREDHNTHDVAALLKEYFRDLPDPIFTRDLYSAFVATRKIKNDEHRLHALSMLISLLPVPNRDTLWTLFCFLSTVVQHSTDVMTETGQLLPGNKMDSTNLATLFGPNLLHKAKGGEYQVDSVERALERKEIIVVIKELIDKPDIFKLQPTVHDELYRRLLETNPEALDHLLKKRSSNTPGGPEIDHETSVSSFLDDSEESSMAHSPDYSSETDPGYPRTFVEAMQLGSTPEVSPGSSQLRIAPQEGPMVYQTSPSPAGTPRGHRPATRARSDNTNSDRTQEITLSVPSSYRLSAPDASEWYRGDRSMSPASPRISPSPKAMKAGTPELRVRIEKSDSSLDKSQHGSTMDVGGNLQVRRSVGVPHGPGPGGYRAKSRNTLSVPVPCSRSKSTESCSSIGSSSGYYAGSSRSGTNSPMTPESGNKRWYIETPPDSPNDGDQSPFHRTSSTHRPLGFNVQKQSSVSSSSSSSSPTKTGGSQHISPQSPSHMNSELKPSRSPHILHRQATTPAWEKQRWTHWEKLTKQKSEEQKEQETLV